MTHILVWPLSVAFFVGALYLIRCIVVVIVALLSLLLGTSPRKEERP